MRKFLLAAAAAMGLAGSAEAKTISYSFISSPVKGSYDYYHTNDYFCSSLECVTSIERIDVVDEVQFSFEIDYDLLFDNSDPIYLGFSSYSGAGMYYVSARSSTGVSTGFGYWGDSQWAASVMQSFNFSGSGWPSNAFYGSYGSFNLYFGADGLVNRWTMTATDDIHTVRMSWSQSDGTSISLEQLVNTGFETPLYSLALTSSVGRLTITSPVPLPMTATILPLGIGALAIARRRRLRQPAAL